MAASLSVAGSLGALDLSIADVRLPVQALCESVRSYPPRPGYPGLTGAPPAREELRDEPAFPIDIISIITDIQRSMGQLSDRTASVPEVYTYYMPAAAGARDPAYVWPPAGPGLPGSELAHAEVVEPRERPGSARAAGERAISGEQKEPATAYVKEPSPGTGDLDSGVRQSSLAVEQLKSDLLGVTRDLAGIEAVIEEIVRLSVAGDISVAHVTPAEAYPRGPVPGTPAIEAPYVEPGLIGREGSPADQPGSGKAKPAPPSGPSELARSVARGASLSKALWGSTIEATVLPAAVAAEIVPDVVSGTVAAESVLNAGELVARGAVMPGAAGIEPAPAVPASPAAPAMAQPSPVIQTIETYNTIVNVVKDSVMSREFLAREFLARDIIPTRGATKAEITRYLLAMPAQPADDRQLKALAELAAALQANARPLATAAAPADTSSGTSLSGDVLDLWLAVRGLQDAYDVLQGIISARTDLTGLHTAVEGLPATAAVSPGEAPVPRLSIALEGVKTHGSSIELPDFTVVNDQFRQMQTMVARLQVPMYAGGGTVTEPSLAFVAESGPEVIVSGQDFAYQIATLNSNYQGLWDDVLVLRDGVKEMVGNVNEAFGSVTGGEDETDDLFQRLYSRFWEHFHISSDDLMNLFSFSSFRKFFNTSVEMAGEYELNVLEEALVPDEVGGGEKGPGGGQAREADEIETMDKEEEEFWDLLDKVDQINTILKKRKGKFDEE